MAERFQRDRRYRLTILPAGARSKTVTFEANYLGEGLMPGDHEFDRRPEAGTQNIPDEMIRLSTDIGPAIWSRS